MEPGAQVRVAGPSRVLLALSTGALVAVTSVATAVAVLSGTGGVAPGQLLEPRPPAAAAPGHPPVVVLPPGAFGTALPERVGDRRPGRASGAEAVASPRRASGSTVVLSLAPELSSPALAPAGGLLPPTTRPVVTSPALSAPTVDGAVTRPGTRRGSGKDEPLLAAPPDGDAATDAPSDSLSGTRTLLRVPSEDDPTSSADADKDKDKAARDKAARDRREFDAQERGRRTVPARRPAAVVPAVPAVPAVSGVAPAVPAVPAVPARPAAAERRRAGAGTPAAPSASRGQRSATQGERTKKPSAAKKQKQKASGSRSGGRAPQGGRGSARSGRS